MNKTKKPRRRRMKVTKAILVRRYNAGLIAEGLQPLTRDEAEVVFFNWAPPLVSHTPAIQVTRLAMWFLLPAAILGFIVGRSTAPAVVLPDDAAALQQ